MPGFQSIKSLFKSKGQQPYKVQISDEERKLVLGRLAASNIASQTAARAGGRLLPDALAAIRRVDKFAFRDPNLKALRPDLVVESIVWMLQNAELTIQFPPEALFSLDPKVLGTQLKNTWDLPQHKTEAYLQKREDAESKLFDYSSDSAVPYAKSHGNVSLQKDTKIFQNPSFTPAARPLYAAINFLRYSGGGAGNSYGKGVFSLHSHVALNSTFTEQDSFKVKDKDCLGTYQNLYPLLVNCNDLMLNVLAEVACLNKAQDMLPGYLEAQNHCAVVFSRDVAAVRMDEAEYTKLAPKQKKNLDLFLSTHGLKHRFSTFTEYKKQLPLPGKTPIEVVRMNDVDF